VRLILDTSVLVSAQRSPAGASRRLIELGLESKFEWLISVPLFYEYESVMTRQEHLTASGLSAFDVGRLLDRVLTKTTRIVLEHHLRIYLPDPDDEHVLALALRGAADGVVTHNVRHFASLPLLFGVNLYSPAQALRLLEKEDG
jgi:putative PIN family toxin of toxin-antitoxin system